MTVHEAKSDARSGILSGAYWGPHGAVARYRESYRASRRTPDDDIPWMSTLDDAIAVAFAEARQGNMLSLWRGYRCAAELRELIALYARIAHDHPMLVRQLPHDHCETLSAVLSRWSESPFSTPYERKATRVYAARCRKT